MYRERENHIILKGYSCFAGALRPGIDRVGAHEAIGRTCRILPPAEID